MTTRTATLKKTVAALRELSEAGLKKALSFVEYLKEKEEWQATAEITNDDETMRAIREAEEDWKEGRLNRFTPLEEARLRQIPNN